MCCGPGLFSTPVDCRVIILCTRKATLTFDPEEGLMMLRRMRRVGGRRGNQRGAGKHCHPKASKSTMPESMSEIIHLSLFCRVASSSSSSSPPPLSRSSRVLSPRNPDSTRRPRQWVLVACGDDAYGMMPFGRVLSRANGSPVDARFVAERTLVRAPAPIDFISSTVPPVAAGLEEPNPPSPPLDPRGWLLLHRMS